MATIVLSAIGTAVGGPLGGALGSLLGNQLDRALLKPGGREGPRLKELQVTSSTYGMPIPRHFGRVRTPGTIIWATDIVESSEKTGGGKKQPSGTAYSYSASFAVAVASRPIKGIGRIWADGRLLRGAGGDLKTGGELRIYSGHGDQQPDPLIAADNGGICPAYKGLAYCVFESLQLADFGNRIPALTFEVLADDGELTLAQMVAPVADMARIDYPLDALVGFSDEGGPLVASLEVIDQLYPLVCDAGGDGLTLAGSEQLEIAPLLLPHAVADQTGDSFAAVSGISRRRQADLRDIPQAVRYYDAARDYQAGMQRADGQPRPGRGRVIEFPATLEAAAARKHVSRAAQRATSSTERLSWRLAEIDPRHSPGTIVRVPDRTGLWRIESWEWRDNGVELDLQRLPHGPVRSPRADAGAVLPNRDLSNGPTIAVAVEMPWNGVGLGQERQVVVAASSAAQGWTGATLFAVGDAGLQPVGNCRRRCIMGHLVNALGPSASLLLDHSVSVELALADPEFVMTSTSIQGLANGANTALIGSEVIQFASAERLPSGNWLLRGLLRGRGGTEEDAFDVHPAGTPFVLLDDRPVTLDPSLVGQAGEIAAAGLADPEPVIAPISAPGRTRRPLCPVHPRVDRAADGSIAFRWTRRARGAFEWQDHADLPLNEEAERYLVGCGNTDAPSIAWQTNEPVMHLSAEAIVQLVAGQITGPIWVRQLGRHGISAPLRLGESIS